jgi:VanZ family protein
LKLSNRTLNRLIIGYLLLVVFVLTASIHPVARLNKIKILAIRLDYLLHFLLFIPWMILARWRWARGEREKSVFLLAAGAGLFLAGFSEVIQIFVPYRSFSLHDFAANGIGLLIGAVISEWVRRSRKAVNRS